MLKNFLKDDGENIIFTGYYMEIYIPETYFSTKMAEIEGTLVKTFGLLTCIVKDKNDKVIVNSTMNMPTTIILHFNDIYRTKTNLYNYESSEPDSYRVLKYYTNNVVMSNVVQKDSSNAELFMKLICAGKIKNVPYDKIIDIWQKNLDLNGVNLGVPSSILELIVAEIYRNPKNPNEKFSKYINNNPSASKIFYRASNIREICSRNSTFTALTFEDFDTMMTASLNMNKYNKKQVESPIEKVIKM